MRRNVFGLVRWHWSSSCRLMAVRMGFCFTMASQVCLHKVGTLVHIFANCSYGICWWFDNGTDRTWLTWGCFGCCGTAAVAYVDGRGLLASLRMTLLRYCSDHGPMLRTKSDQGVFLKPDHASWHMLMHAMAPSITIPLSAPSSTPSSSDHSQYCFGRYVWRCIATCIDDSYHADRGTPPCRTVDA